MSSRLLKELRSLAPWQWDARVNLHPAGASSLRDFSLIESAILEAEPGHSKTRQASETQKDVTTAPVQAIKSKPHTVTEPAIKDFTPGPSKRPASAGRPLSRPSASLGSGDPDDASSCFEVSADGGPASVQRPGPAAPPPPHPSSLDSKPAGLDARSAMSKRPRRILSSPGDPAAAAQDAPAPTPGAAASRAGARMANLLGPMEGHSTEASADTVQAASAADAVVPTPSRAAGSLSYSSRQSPISSGSPAAPQSASPWVPRSAASVRAAAGTPAQQRQQHSASKPLDFPSAAKQLQVRASLAKAMESEVTQSLQRSLRARGEAAMAAHEGSDDGDNAFNGEGQELSARQLLAARSTAAASTGGRGVSSPRAASAAAAVAARHSEAGDAHASPSSSQGSDGLSQAEVTAGAMALSALSQGAALSPPSDIAHLVGAAAAAAAGTSSLSQQGGSPAPDSPTASGQVLLLAKRSTPGAAGHSSKSLPSGNAATAGTDGGAARNSGGGGGGGVQQLEGGASPESVSELDALQEEGRGAVGSGFDDILQAVESFCKANSLAPTIENIRTILLSLQLLPAQQRSAAAAAGVSSEGPLSTDAAAAAAAPAVSQLAFTRSTGLVTALPAAQATEPLPVAALIMPPVTTMESTEAEWNSRLSAPVCAVYQQLLSGQRALHDATAASAAHSNPSHGGGPPLGAWPLNHGGMQLTSMPPPQQSANHVVREALAAAAASGMQQRAGGGAQQRFMDMEEGQVAQLPKSRAIRAGFTTTLQRSSAAADAQQGSDGSSFPGFSALSASMGGGRTDYARQQQQQQQQQPQQRKAGAGLLSSRPPAAGAGNQHGGSRGPTLLATMVSQNSLAAGGAAATTMQQAPVSHSVYGVPQPLSPSGWRSGPAWPVPGPSQQPATAQQQGHATTYRYPQQQQQQHQQASAQQQQVQALSQHMYLQQQQVPGRSLMGALPAGVQRQVLKQPSALGVAGLPVSGGGYQGLGLGMEGQENLRGMYDAYGVDPAGCAGLDASKSFNWKKSKMSSV
ncbi:MAG: hypothetical protein WDW36_002599 [Sanguina aurantia]